MTDYINVCNYMGHFEIRPLTLEQVNEWCKFTPNLANDALPKLLHSLKNEISITRFLVYSNSRVLARFSTLVEDGALIFWWPTYHHDVSEADIMEINNYIIEFMIKLFQERGLSVLECKIKVRSSFLQNWYECLLKKGMRHLSTKREYSLSLDTVPGPFGNIDANLHFSYGGSSPLIDKELYRKAVVGSMDMSDIFSVSRGAELTNYDQVIYLHESNKIIGFQALEIHREERLAWTLFIGILPEWRGKGLGKYLLNAGMEYAGSSGMRYYKALIDQANVPSVRTYESLGFIRSDEEIFYILYG